MKPGFQRLSPVWILWCLIKGELPSLSLSRGLHEGLSSFPAAYPCETRSDFKTLPPFFSFGWNWLMISKRRRTGVHELPYLHTPHTWALLWIWVLCLKVRNETDRMPQDIVRWKLGLWQVLSLKLKWVLILVLFTCIQPFYWHAREWRACYSFSWRERTSELFCHSSVWSHLNLALLSQCTWIHPWLCDYSYCICVGLAASCTAT